MRPALRVLGAAAVALAVVGSAAPPAGAAATLRVHLTTDQPVVTVDRDAPRDVVLLYEIVVTNGGDAPAPGVVVEAALPGGAVRRDVGDLGPAGEWREVFEVTLASATVQGGPVDAVAVARSTDGAEVASAPARVDLQVISSAVIERADEPAPEPSPVSTAAPAPAVVPPAEVLGATYARPRPTTLARTGVGLAGWIIAGVALVLLGGLVVRRTTAEG